MPILRSLEVRIQPGRRQEWGAFIRDVKKVVDKHGAPARVLQLQFGGHPGTAIVSVACNSWEELAARTEKVNADPDYLALMASGAKTPGFPYAEAVEVRLLEDITAEVGGASTSLESAQTIQVISMRLLPGKRAKQLEIIRQIREARTGSGLPVSTILQTAAGAANVLLIARPYASLQAWAKDRATPELAGVVDILQRAQSDPQGPYVEPISTRVFSDITAQL